MTTGLPGLVENLLGFSVLVVGLFFELLQTVPHFTLPHYVDVVGLVTLVEKLASSDFNDILELFVKMLELAIIEHFKGGDLPEVDKHFFLFPFVLLLLEDVPVLSLDVE